MIQLGCILEDYSDLAEMQWCIQYCSRNCFSRSVSGKQKADVSGTQARNSERISMYRDTDKWFSILLRDQGIILIPNFTFFAWTFSIHEHWVINKIG